MFANPHILRARIVTWSRRAAVCALACLLLLALAAPGLGVTITLRESAQVAGPQVTLGEIAAIAEADADTAARFSAITVGAAPLAGRSRQLSLDSLRVQLRRSGVDPDALRLLGPRMITVTRAAQVVAGARIEQAAREALLARLPLGGDPIVTCARPPKDIVVPTGEIELQPQITTGPRGPSSIVRVLVVVDGEVSARSTVCLRVERYDQVLVAARDIPRGQALAAAALTLERRDLMRIPGTPLTDLAAAAGCRARLRLGTGTPVTAQAIEPIPVIKRGDLVIVTLRVGAVRITLSGVARCDAAAGQAVRVLNAASKREFTARATARGAAEITL